MGSGCVAQVYRAKARAESVKDPAFQELVEGLEKEDLLEAWEVPGFGGALGYFWGSEKGEEEMSESAEVGSGKLQCAEDKVLIPVAIKVNDYSYKEDDSGLLMFFLKKKKVLSAAMILSLFHTGASSWHQKTG